MMRNIRRSILALAAACACAAPAHAAQNRAYVFTTDYSTGGLSVVDLDTRAVDRDVAPGICPDSRLVWHEGLLYVIGRQGCDNVLVLDPARDFHVVRQFSTGNGSNPSDIVVLSATKAYVPRYELADLAIVNPSTGAITGQISFAAFADADGIPEMDRAIRVGDRVFVSVQRLDRAHGFQPTDTSLVVAIDAGADTVIDADPLAPGTQAIRLTGANPVTAFAYDSTSRRLLIGCTGVYGVADGGIEWVDPVTLSSGGFAITGMALGGDVSDVVWKDAAHSYAIISDASFNASLVSWSATLGTVLGTVYSPGGFSLGDAELNDRGELYVCNNGFTSPGLHVFSTPDDQPIAGPLDCGLPPNQIVFGEELIGPPLIGVRFTRPSPNPARVETRIAFESESAGNLRLEVFDVSGRSVRIVADGLIGAGPHEVRWDLLDGSGARVRPGIYLMRATLDRNLVRNSDTGLFNARITVLE